MSYESREFLTQYSIFVAACVVFVGVGGTFLTWLFS